MFIQHRRQCVNFVIVGSIIGLLLAGGVNSAVAYPLDSDTKVYLTSRFLLWDTTEKMIDPQFDIHIFYFNISTNHTANYYANVGGNEINGTFQHYINLSYNINYTDIITNLEIIVNNNTVFEAQNIIVIEGISQQTITRPYEPFYLKFLPSEWTAKEWNIFYAVLISALLSIFISYRLAYRYRERMGVRQVA